MLRARHRPGRTLDNATSLGGKPASAYASRVGTAGIVKEAGTPGGATVTLITSGPFDGHHDLHEIRGRHHRVEVAAASSEAASDLNGHLAAAAHTPTDIGFGVGPTASFGSDNNTTLDFEAPSGALLIVSGGGGGEQPQHRLLGEPGRHFLVQTITAVGSSARCEASGAANPAPVRGRDEGRVVITSR